MKRLLQILFFLLTWCNLSATTAFSKVALPNYAVFFPKTTNPNLESERKIGVSNFARSGILENSFSQKYVLWESYKLENRARETLRVFVNGAGKSTLQQIDEYVTFATTHGDELKVMLGKFDDGATTGYISRAGNTHAFFDMGNAWDDVLASVGGDLDEMWKINKKFIDNRKYLGNEFFLSHSPVNPTGFYKREIEYLINPISQGGPPPLLVLRGRE